MILISNDDGYQAKGIQFLLNIVKDYDNVLVCAPDAARSGFACAFTANDPLYLTPRHQEQGVEVWSCNGTPGRVVYREAPTDSGWHQPW